jgi:two-component system, cell cycle sensor histidine kinase and response regulator CckA
MMDSTPATTDPGDLSGVFQNMLEGFALHEIILDDRGTPVDYRFLAVNPAFERLTGLAAAAFVGRTAREVLPGIEDAWVRRYGQVALGGGATRFEDYNRDLDKTFLVNAFSPAPGRFACTFLDVTDNRRAEKAMRLNDARLESLLAITQRRSGSVQDLLDFALGEAIRLTESRFGYLYFYDESRREFTLNTWSRSVMEACTIAEKKTVYQLEATGIWGEAVRQRRPVILNDFAAPHPLKRGLPPGHAPLRTYMTIPVFSGESIVAVLGVANKEAGYDDADVRQLKLLMEPVWRIVERAQAEEKARESQARIESVLEETGTGLDIVDSSHRLLYVNAGTEKRLGPVAGRLCHEYFHGRATPCPSCTMARAVREGGRVVTEGLREADGRWVQVTTIPYRAAGGGWLVSEIQVDITERRRNEEALRSARELMSNLLERAPVSISVVSAEGRLQLVNRQWEKETGRTRGEAVGAALGDLFPAETAGAYEGDNHRVMATDAPLVVEETVGPPAAARHFHTVKFPLHDAEGRVEAVGGMALDITEMRRAEAERGRLERQMQRAQKLESLGVLAGGIAHDFNNLLMAILGNAEMALEDVPADHPARVSLEEVETAARRAADLTRQMLAYSGKGSFVVSRVNLTRAVEEMSHLLGAFIPKTVSLEKRIDPGLPVIEADASQVQQVIMNLLINASEAIGPDVPGRILVQTGVQAFTADCLARSRVPHGLAAGAHVFLSVADTGCGISPETLEKIFDPFFSTKSTGRGLGLAAVLGIVRGHNGAIVVESERGKGTAFTLAFPAAGAAPGRDREGTAAAGREWRGSGTVLLADDDEPVLRLGTAMLERLGFRVACARDGAEAVSVFRERERQISFAVLDLTMPVMGGIEACDRILALSPRLPIILSSGYSREDMAEKTRRRSVAGFLQKPFRLAALRELAMEIASGRGEEALPTAG